MARSAGSRSGKTRMAAAISVHIGAIEQHTLAPGEVGYVLLLAATPLPGPGCFRLCLRLSRREPNLRQQILSITAGRSAA